MKAAILSSGFWEKFTDEERKLIRCHAHKAGMTVGEFIDKMLSDYLTKRREEAA